jgi:hypothetical protein
LTARGENPDGSVSGSDARGSADVGIDRAGASGANTGPIFVPGIFRVRRSARWTTVQQDLSICVESWWFEACRIASRRCIAAA